MNEDLKEFLIGCSVFIGAVVVLVSLIFWTYVLFDKYNYNQCVRRTTNAGFHYPLLHCR